MNLKKKLKKFFALTRCADDGFTLVELIVVIAILGVLAGVGTVGYSGYVKKANMAADQALISGVKNALQLGYYGDMPNRNSGYVILTDAGAETDVADGFVDKTMAAAFGEDWRTTCVLKYNGWTSGGLLDVVAEYSDAQVQSIAESTFMQNMEGAVDATGELLTLAAGRIENKLKQLGTIDQYLEDLGMELGEDLEDLSEADKSMAVSNMLVGHFAKAMSASGSGEMSADTAAVVGLATLYAQVYASGNAGLLESMDTILATATYEEITADNNVSSFMRKLRNANSTGFSDFQTNYTDGEKDKEALNYIMKAVSVIADDYTDKDSLTNTKLFSVENADLMGQVSSFSNAIEKRMAGEFPDSGENSVMILLYENGMVDSNVALDG